MESSLKLPKIHISRSSSSKSDAEDTNKVFEQTTSGNRNSRARQAWKRASKALVLPLLHVNLKTKRKISMCLSKNQLVVTDEKLGPTPGKQLISPKYYSTVGYNYITCVKDTDTIPFYSFQKDLLAKFRMAVRLTVFCARKFKEHCLR